MAESSNPPAVPTITEVVQSGCPNQLAALAPGLNTLPSEQQLKITAVNFPRPVITNSSPPSLAAVNQLPSLHIPSAVALTTSTTVPPASQTLSVPSQTQQFVIPVPSQPLLTIPSSHAMPNFSAWTFPAGNSLPITQYAAPPPSGGQFIFSYSRCTDRDYRWKFGSSCSSPKLGDNLLLQPSSRYGSYSYWTNNTTCYNTGTGSNFPELSTFFRSTTNASDSNCERSCSIFVRCEKILSSCVETGAI